MRNFVGVIKDISENYFVPSSIRRRSIGIDFLGTRYTDCGAFFSATGFSRGAQTYAWAQNIYLVSLRGYPSLTPLLERLRHLIDGHDEDFRRSRNKKKIVIIAEEDLNRDNALKDSFSKIAPYIGIVDGAYPVLIVTDGKLDFDPKLPDDISVAEEFLDQPRYFGRGEMQSSGDLNFILRVQQRTLSFGLPVLLSQIHLYAVKDTYKLEPFSYIEIPIVLKQESRVFRRIFRINLVSRKITEFLDRIKFKG